MRFNVNEAIEHLVADYEDRTLNERAILLFQLQTWIYFPRGGLVDFAGVIAATHFLELYARQHFRETGPERNSARRLKSWLDDAPYCRIYDAFLKPFGGWTRLLRAPSLKSFGGHIERRRRKTSIVCDLIDYRFRYLVHGGQIRREANFSHRVFYCWKGDKIDAGKLKGTPLRRTIISRWSELQESAELVYVSDRHGGTSGRE